MSTSTNKCEIIARVRWNRVGRSAWEAALAAAGCLGPGARAAVRRRIAQGVYDCRESEVFLYKSGRAALRGLMEGLRAACPERRAAFVPDYVCNVVGDACRAAGFAVREYPTDARCQPDWKALEEGVRR